MDFIDRIYYINLKTRPDREQHFLKEIDTFVPEFKNKVERFGAIKCDIGGIGCTLSHIEVLKNARQHGYGYVIVFEDDLNFQYQRKL
jgi:glycosyl transferase family 25